MKLNNLRKIDEALETLALFTQTDIAELIAALTGVAWFEEDAGEITRYVNGDDE